MTSCSKEVCFLAADESRRPTRDIDLQATHLTNDADTVLALARDIAAIHKDDGLVYDTGTATAEVIRDESTIDVEILPKIDAALGQEVVAARKAVHELAERQREVAALSRAAAKDLAESGLSGADIAVVLDVSPQRVSQLLHA